MAALALLGMVLAYWTWAFFSPDSASRSASLQTAPVLGNELEAANRLFGHLPQGSSGGRTGTSTITFRLLGVVAAPGTRSGYAVLRLDAKRTVAVREGEEIEPDVRLLEVHADHVVLERGGQRETLAWVAQGKVLGSSVPGGRN